MSTTSEAISTANRQNEIELVEVELLLEGVFRLYGYDFRQYSTASLKRRVRGLMEQEGVASVSLLQARILHDPACMERFLLALSINVTSMYRDPEFFLTFRNKAIPLLRTYPFIRIWHSGCSTGEEVYSMAILLHEEGLYDRCRIYATDLNETVLKNARAGIFPLAAAEEYAVAYKRAGGKRALSDYYTAAYGSALFRSSLRDHIVFSQHNLATDGSFNEFNVILCRNVMIYFTKPLQDRVHNLLYDSLARFGVLGLGSKESLQFSPHEREYEALECGSKLYRRIG